MPSPPTYPDPARYSKIHPGARFTVGFAMCRNKYIYTLAKYAVVVSASSGKGGTWAGATENLKYKWTPLFVRAGDNMPEGNQLLIEKGGVPLRPEILEDEGGLRATLEFSGAKSLGYTRPGTGDARVGEPEEQALFSCNNEISIFNVRYISTSEWEKNKEPSLFDH